MSKVLMKSMLMLLSLIALLNHTGCHHSEGEHHKEEINFLVTSPVIKDTSIIKNYVCQIHAIQHIELRAMERGYLENTFVDEGKFVKKGQLMFQLLPIVYQSELEIARAEAKVAEIEYLNTKVLADSNVVSLNELALAEAKYQRAQAEVSLAKAHLEFTKIRAPFDGIVDRFHVRLGSLLDEGELLSSLSDNSEMWVYFNVPEAEYIDYKRNVKRDSLMNVKLRLANSEIFEYNGVVKTIEADFNNETGNIAFRATFPNPDGLLRHGETGNILMNEPIKNAMLIPQKATYEVLDKKYVFVVNEDNIVKARQITIGSELPHIYVVDKGLEVTDKILLEGLRLVKENDEIHYEFIEPDSALATLDLYAE